MSQQLPNPAASLPLGGLIALVALGALTGIACCCYLLCRVSARIEDIQTIAAAGRAEQRQREARNASPSPEDGASPTDIEEDEQIHNRPQ